MKFSPSANRSVQLEQIISMMMEPDPALRPDIDKVLLHPNVQAAINKTSVGKSTSSPIVSSKSPIQATTPMKSTAKTNYFSLHNDSSKATLIISPSTVALEMQQ